MSPKKKVKPKKSAPKSKSAKPKAKKPAAKKPTAKKPMAKLKPNKPAPKASGKKAGKSGLHVAYIGLGSNVGERDEYIEQACFLLTKMSGIKVTKRSSNIETEAEGVEDQPAFMNAVAEIETSLSPQKLLEALQETEQTLGRERGAEWGPRTIDMDILLYDDMIVSEEKLQIPHPLMHERKFVLKPMSELAPELLHPTLEKTMSELYEDLKADNGGTYDDELPGFKAIKQGAPDDFERW